MSSSEAVACHGLERRFGERAVLRGVDLSVAAGETVVVTGPNGAGKTTLLRVLAAVLRPGGGSVSVLGHALPADGRAARRRLGYAAHDPLLYPGLTAQENLELFAALHGAPAASAPAALDRVGMAARAGDRVSELSRGMRQRLSLARAVLHGPDLLLLDEPTTGLDEEGRGVLRDLLAGGAAAVVTTHEPAWFGGARTLYLQDGRAA
jgi:heme exporter protein A